MSLKVFKAYLNLMDKLNVKPTAYAAKEFNRAVKEGVIKI